MTTLEKLIKKRVDRLESIPQNLLTVIDKQNEKLYKAALEQLSKLDSKDGQIVASPKNLAAVSNIIENLKSVLFDGEYLDAIKTFALEIQQQALLNNSILKEVAGSFEDKELYKATIVRSQKNALMLLDENAIRANLLQPLEELLNNSVISKVNIPDAIENLRTSLTGENATLTKYAGQIVRDTFAVSDRQYVKLTAESNKIEFYRYSGGEVDGTREFCAERHGQYFHIKEIEAWGAFENTDPSIFKFPKFIYETKAGVKIYWAGMNYNTNSGTISSYLGGYECNHVLVPVATQYVNEEVKARAIRLGYFKEAA